MRTREPGRARRDPENFTALSPLTFLPRTAAIHADRVAIVHGDAASRMAIMQPRTPPAPPQPWADLPKGLELPSARMR